MGVYRRWEYPRFVCKALSIDWCISWGPHLLSDSQVSPQPRYVWDVPVALQQDRPRQARKTNGRENSQQSTKPTEDTSKDPNW